MAFKIVALFALVAVAYAAPGAVIGAPAVYAAPAVAAASNARDIYRSQDVFGNYNAGYHTADGLTGDIKSSNEQGSLGVKVGSNSQLDPNGYIRTTDYVSDALGTRQVITGSENGLYVNAKDHAIRPNAAPVAAPVVARAAYAAPLSYAAAPLSYAHGLGVHSYAHGLGLHSYAHPLSYGAHPYLF